METSRPITEIIAEREISTAMKSGGKELFLARANFSC